MNASISFSDRVASLAAAAVIAIGASTIVATPALAADPAPAWEVTSLATPTNFVPGDSATDYTYDVRLANIGAAPTDGSPITIIDTLPAGIEVVGDPEVPSRFVAPGVAVTKAIDLAAAPYEICDVETVGAVSTLTCTLPTELEGDLDKPAIIYPLEELSIVIHVTTPASLEIGTTLVNQVEVEGGGAPPASTTSENEASADPASRGFSYYHALVTGMDGQPDTQAGSHPYQVTTSFAFNTRAFDGTESRGVAAGGDVKDVRLALPPGFVGNPNAADLCTAQEFNTVFTKFIAGSQSYAINACPDSSAVGVLTVRGADGFSQYVQVPVYNLVPAPGMPAQLGFTFSTIPFFIDTEVRSGGDYGIDAVLRNQSQAKRVTSASVTIWGTPWADSHDGIRGNCLAPAPYRISRLLYDTDCDGKVTADPKPFFRLPTSCAEALDLTMSFTNWTNPLDPPISSAAPFGTPTGCNQLDFEPSLEAHPTTDVADSPSGLHVDLHLPQGENEDPEGQGQADLREVTVAFPRGIAINPSSANGLGACSPDEVGLLTSPGAVPRFSPDAARCPDAARLGTVKVDTPLLDHPLNGSVYAATPYRNPFNSLLAIYIAIQDPRSGVVVKLPGRVTPDPLHGQLTATFAENPQLPFEDFELDFFGGPFAALRTPAVCGSYTTNSVMTPWSAPESGPPAAYSDPYAINRAPGGGACPTSEGQLPFAPAFDAGVVAPIARAFSPLVLDLRRGDGSAEFASLTVTTPPGLLGSLAGISYCPDAALALAAGKTGAEEKASTSCPANSQVGTATVGAGAGPVPYFTQGAAYLAGPYKGAPLSLAVVTPATAGPYDLGTVVVRTALNIDPETTRITAVSDPIPHILKGIPLDVRRIAIKLDRTGFTLNPTSCNRMEVVGEARSTSGRAAPLQTPFQVAECGALAFKPKLSLRLKGGTQRSDHPALTATLTMPPGAANMARASVALPHSEFLDQAHIGTICTRVQFAADACPKGSVYGHARAITPLLDQPLEGPVYLRSSNNPLPDLVADLQGQIDVVLVGRIDSVRGGIRTTFEAVPDAPVSKFVLSMRGGKKGLLENSRDICRRPVRAVAQLDAQNGKVGDSRPKLVADCRGKMPSHKGHRRHAVG